MDAGSTKGESRWEAYVGVVNVKEKMGRTQYLYYFSTWIVPCTVELLCLYLDP